MPPSISQEHGALMTRINAAIDAVMPCLGSLYLKAKNQRMQHFGSCVFVVLRGREYILTASHCFEKRKLGAIQIGGPSKIAPLKGTFAYTQKRLNLTEPDDIDIAIAPLDPELKATIGASCFPITKGKLQNVWAGPPPFDTWHRYTVVGFPSSQNSASLSAVKGASRNAWAFTTQVQSEADVPQRTHFDADRHLFLAWDYKQTEDETRQLINPPHLNGTSGGAILSIGNHIDAVSHPVRVVGLLTDFLGPKRTIVGTRLSAIVESLDAANAWPIASQS